jgi:hypothetical protein
MKVSSGERILKRSEMIKYHPYCLKYFKKKIEKTKALFQITYSQK